ncbi:unnamed protein product [Aphanomyces euteiches]|uniref:proline--tRNA ligase n=1 Tax=Aphanomyces euteiches TaxID=100861 RepID=A0A6G0XH03_9STRA|nr:hypothetical protein Ae201684_004734 [Aphanomyces euteiches]KAH9073217.1 hypothetical protein Ae201684P_015034 [Aphanomyces euteiches]KAH9153101.1 hypothetical protein AeRB84_004583 [Aphanomyces euteiches]
MLRRLHSRPAALSLSARRQFASYAVRSSIFIPTTREVPADAAIPSHQLLLRAGFMRKSSNGIYMMMPLALRSLAKLEAIIDFHMHEIGCSKLSMPNLLHHDLWQATGRWDSSGPELFRVNDRRDVAHCLGPTHEEVFTSLVASTVTSPKALPLRLYQIGRKFRDEVRPRFGLLRAKEFVMKDAYTFDVDREGAEVTYGLMVKAYHAILRQLELPIGQVEADTGNIGGSLSHEFHVLSGFGEDALLSCSSCDYAANVEKARSSISMPEESFSSPVTSLADAASHSGLHVTWFQEKLDAETRTIAVVTPAGYEVNRLALKPFADEAKLQDIAAPEATEPSLVLVDATAASVVQIASSEEGDFHLARANDGCPCCQDGVLEEKRGIEVGHVFYLGQKYSKALDAKFVDAQNQTKLMEMGCYGMGITRLLAASVESLHDSHGIVWPRAIVPYQAVVIGLAKSAKDNEAVAASSIAASLSKTFPDDVVLDDRWTERPGIKLTEAELIGYTWRIVVGKRFASEGLVEVLYRPTMEVQHVPLDQLEAHLQSK